MAHVIAADVVVPLEVAGIGVIALAHFPVARRAHTMQHGAIVQHGQIEATAVPGNELRAEFLDAVEKALDDGRFVQFGGGQRPYLEALARAQDTGNADHPMHM